ncbi:unnamed protein product [Amoebophrya sp. A120]|nr:unnamed protein product [Amoebophrya sp. A120]|eukprot:GSA120T00011234001.1
MKMKESIRATAKPKAKSEQKIKFKLLFRQYKVGQAGYVKLGFFKKKSQFYKADDFIMKMKKVKRFKESEKQESSVFEEADGAEDEEGSSSDELWGAFTITEIILEGVQHRGVIEGVEGGSTRTTAAGEVEKTTLHIRLQTQLEGKDEQESEPFNVDIPLDDDFTSAFFRFD